MTSNFTSPWTLDILSTDAFPGVPPPFSYPASGEASLLGVVDELAPLGGAVYDLQNTVKEEEHQLASNQGRKRAPPKKNSKSKSKAEANPEVNQGSRKRGRPRVHTGDETAAERRRTQIRLAQQAYRLRKEAVITTLNDRVRQLEATIDEMNKRFLSFHDIALESGVVSTHPQLAQRLRETTQSFLDLASDVSRSSDDESQEQQEEIQDIQLPVETPPIQQPPPTLPMDNSSTNPSDVLVTPHGIRTAVQQPLLPDSAPEPQSTTVAFPSLDARDPNTYLDYRFLQEQELQFLLSNSMSIPHEPSICRRYTYSFQELCFSRRLHRRCLEMGYASLINPNCNPNHLNYTFRFTFGIATRERLALVFRSILDRKAGESLEVWSKPFFYIGNAGMHYPRQDEFGNVIFPPNMHPPERAFGPFAFNNVEKPHQCKSVEELVDANGFGGDWFDCRDVEGYLIEKGIVIHSRATFLRIPQSAVPGYTSSISSPSTRSSAGSLDPQPLYSDVPDIDPQPNYSLAAATTNPAYYPLQNEVCSQMMDLLGLPQDPTFRFGAISPPTTNISSDSYQTPDNQPSLILDVDNFITQLVTRCVCLGRAPGIRKHDVDAALLASVSSQW
ncbi:hypothetical protein LOZ58_004669 [Ophidiomyces ophidiicola]|nr:hypothetical protein LOZ58_004669 [Ophidiomyces ophidiicola]